MNVFTENTLLIDFDVHNPADTFSRLIKFGGGQGYITYDDIIRLFPEAEQDVDFLDQIYLAIRKAGILFVEDDRFIDIPDEDSEKDDVSDEYDSKSKYIDDAHLLEVEPDNLVGLYFSEATRRPLLTYAEEVDLAKRIDRGAHASEELSGIEIQTAKRKEELLVLIDDSWIAVDKLITANSRLVISIAKKYMHRGVPFLDFNSGREYWFNPGNKKIRL